MANYLTMHYYRDDTEKFQWVQARGDTATQKGGLVLKRLGCGGTMRTTRGSGPA
jgi:hypothetical protein